MVTRHVLLIRGASRSLYLKGSRFTGQVVRLRSIGGAFGARISRAAEKAGAWEDFVTKGKGQASLF
jgi:hypothetical protein